MIRYFKIPLIALLALLVVVPMASARPRVFIGGGFYGGPVYWGPGWYGPGWVYGPGYYWGPYYGGAASPTGSIKFDTKAKDAMVYVDGSYAGTVGSLKTFHLKTGEHDMELRDPSGHTYFQEHVNVLPGKTLDLNPNAPPPPDATVAPTGN